LCLSEPSVGSVGSEVSMIQVVVYVVVVYVEFGWQLNYGVDEIC
jgi:hypothetical protein